MLITRRDMIRGAAVGLTLPAIAPGLAVAADPPVTLKMTDLYGKEEDFSPQAKQLVGKPVTIQGYMAPPLKPDSKFFVLADIPMAVCPFCADVAAWPENIVVIYTPRPIEVMPFDLKITTTGKLDLGPWIDPATGFVSKVRLAD